MVLDPRHREMVLAGLRICRGPDPDRGRDLPHIPLPQANAANRVQIVQLPPRLAHHLAHQAVLSPNPAISMDTTTKIAKQVVPVDQAFSNYLIGESRGPPCQSTTKSREQSHDSLLIDLYAIALHLRRLSRPSFLGGKRVQMNQGAEPSFTSLERRTKSPPLWGRDGRLHSLGIPPPQVRWLVLVKMPLKDIGC